MAAKPLPVLLESGQRRVFASVADWPGWCRSGKNADGALDALEVYAPRYAEVVRKAGKRMPAQPTFEIVERLTGNATTDFGAPGAIAKADHEALTKAQLQRVVALLEASWATLDDVVKNAPARLRKGPRGGGRDRDAVAQHVVNAEVAYARRLGLVKVREPKHTDGKAVRALRDQLIEAMLARPDAAWPVRYAARRITWHALDHAWEIEDKSE